MPTVQMLLAVVAFLCIIASAANPPRVPLWVGCLLLSVLALLGALR